VYYNYWFGSFNGNEVNVTALPFAPYWDAETSGNVTTYSGCDFEMIKSISKALNFALNVMPSANWDDVCSTIKIHVVR